MLKKSPFSSKMGILGEGVSHGTHVFGEHCYLMLDPSSINQEEGKNNPLDNVTFEDQHHFPATETSFALHCGAWHPRSPGNGLGGTRGHW